MKYLSIENTKDSIAHLEDRIDDIEYHLEKTHEWCDQHYIDDNSMVFMCCFLTCIWVSQLRGELITYVELMEMLGIHDIEVNEEKFYELDLKYENMTHRELLESAVDKFRDC